MVLCRELNEWQFKHADKYGFIKETKSQTPNYSFDAWLKKAKDLGGEVSFAIDRAKERDAELDKEIEQKKQKSKKEDDSDIKNDKESSWKKFKDVAKERKQKEKEDSSDQLD